MTRLEALRQQKREIEAEIKKLTNKVVEVGRCKFHLEHYASRPDEWIVTYKSRSYSFRGDEKNKRLIAHPDKKVAIEQIAEVINDLQALQSKLLEDLKGDNDENSMYNS